MKKGANQEPEMEEDDSQLALLLAEGSDEVDLVNFEGIYYLLDMDIGYITIITIEPTTPLSSTSTVCDQTHKRSTVTYFV